jgi:hypothetical protein
VGVEYPELDVKGLSEYEGDEDNGSDGDSDGVSDWLWLLEGGGLN